MTDFVSYNAETADGTGAAADDSYYEVSSDISVDTAEEDAPTVNYVEQAIEAAETGGYLNDLALRLEGATTLDTTALDRLVAEASTAETPDEPAVPLTREQIREKIFARLRRPDGTPYEAGYQTGPAARGAEYEGEDERAGAWRFGEAGKDRVERTTKYYDRDTIDERASSADGAGLMLDENGEPVDGKWGWVIDDATGYVLLFDENDNDWFTPTGEPYTKQSWERAVDLWSRGYRIKQIHHTTQVAGMPVTGAGRIAVERGVIKKITDESGHYKPDAAQQYEAIQALMDQGYSLEQAKIKLTGRTMGEKPTGKAEWIDEAAARNPDFPTGNVKLRTEQFEQTQGDEFQIRSKQAVNQQINRLGERPGTQTVEGWGSVEQEQVEDESDDDDDDDDGTFLDDEGRRMRNVPDPNNPGYLIARPVEDDPGTYVYDNSEVGGGYTYQDTGVQSAQRGPSTIEEPSSPYDNPDAGGYADQDTDLAPEGDSSPEDTTADFVSDARSYLESAGRSQFAEWFRGLPSEHQDVLLADPQIAAAWRGENAQAQAPAPPQWQPAEGDHAAAARANATFVDELDDRATAPFTVAGFALVIGDGHDARLRQYADAAADAVTGTMTVRKAGLGRGNGSLTFTGVPPAKQDVVREAVRRFSRKEVRFAAAGS